MRKSDKTAQMTKTNKLIEQVFETLNKPGLEVKAIDLNNGTITMTQMLTAAEIANRYTITNNHLYNIPPTNYATWTGGTYTFPNAATIQTWNTPVVLGPEHGFTYDAGTNFTLNDNHAQHIQAHQDLLSSGHALALVQAQALHFLNNTTPNTEEE